MGHKIVFMPHANIQYSQLDPAKRGWVVRESYEKLFDLLLADARYKIAFEASGRTLEVIADECPDVMEKLKELIKRGQLEPVGSPHIHVMLTNLPKQIGLDTLRHGIDTWEKYTGVRPLTGWNPECGWASFLPEIYQEAGFKNLVMDADSFLLSFEEIRDATGLKYDVQGHSNKNHLFRIEEYIQDKPDFLKYITHPSKSENGLRMIFRSDCMANPMLWFLMGATEGMRKDPISLSEINTMLEKWHGRIDQSGYFIMPYAEDAEYIGTSAYFYVKQFNQARFFEPEPESVSRFKQLLDAAIDAKYELSLPNDVIDAADELPVNPYINCIENGVAWHGGTAKAWANTDYSLLFDPVCLSVYQGVCEVRDYCSANGITAADDLLKAAMRSVTSAYVSDSRWPPAPTSPGRFNVRESLDDLYAANKQLREAMDKAGMSNLRSFYSPNLMETQIRCIEEKLMAKDYFGE